VLVYLRSESVIAKTLQLIQNRQTPEPPPWTELASRNRGYGGAIFRMIETLPPSREIQYAFMLRELRDGWTLDQRRDYFTFINEAAKTAGGASFAGYLTRMRDEALGNCPTEQRKALEEITGEDFDPKPDFPIMDPVGPGKKWTVGETLAAARGPANFERGRSLFFSTKCASCHRVRGLGGAIGPDLTSIRNKFDAAYVLESIVEPSKVISDQYGSFAVTTKGGAVHTGLAVEREKSLEVYPVDAKAEPIVVKREEIAKIEPVAVSQMPPGLINPLNGDELRDLMAYLMSAGDPKDKVYGK
jgi:putative heme-binding domain-containing protein